ncbi:type II toxin-antitoxin system death-on-curing family toxin [Phenylobacterium sp.]|uniref:type II toxin-antitoxin system death-on-curing family toxin n=1 Tax=Phenylobacterium sp. TaxID=1871053 RepID=UPI0025F327D4|nr:type II toxin-antitoxin system death-on-curing family toxin [Phenylobacterium sp.]MBX3484163.1 type II toxin-antitoxin system death-on-curing family toxin [Phenylobacterium sp.]MCW5759214.1 type II toxin-antitoxin system death-on-curing family toxin [Phenylobacterium sp.]
MSEPGWISKEALLVLHDRSLALHGGAAGLRDEGLLESALQRPQNRHYYEGVGDVCELAATYLVALVSNHPFIDGNKRAGFLAAGLFLRKNGRRLVAAQADAARAVLAVAAGQRDVEQLATWLRERSIEEEAPKPPPAAA